MAAKLKCLKHKIKDWAKIHFGDVEIEKSRILEEIQNLDRKEETDFLSKEERGADYP